MSNKIDTFLATYLHYIFTIMTGILLEFGLLKSFSFKLILAIIICMLLSIIWYCVHNKYLKQHSGFKSIRAFEIKPGCEKPEGMPDDVWNATQKFIKELEECNDDDDT